MEISGSPPKVQRPKPDRTPPKNPQTPKPWSGSGSVLRTLAVMYEVIIFKCMFDILTVFDQKCQVINLLYFMEKLTVCILYLCRVKILILPTKKFKKWFPTSVMVIIVLQKMQWIQL